MSFELKKIKKINGAMIITPSSFIDNRGSIRTIFNSELCLKLDVKSFNHSKLTYSNKDVFRGFHGDTKSWKLVQCIEGVINQYIYDARKNSSTFGKVYKITLTDKDENQILVPPGCLNAFHTLSSRSGYLYNLSYEGEYIDSKDQMTIAWNDDRIKLDLETPITQQKDNHSNI